VFHVLLSCIYYFGRFPLVTEFGDDRLHDCETGCKTSHKSGCLLGRGRGLLEMHWGAKGGASLEKIGNHWCSATKCFEWKFAVGHEWCTCPEVRMSICSYKRGKHLPLGLQLEVSRHFGNHEISARWITSYPIINKSAQLGHEISETSGKIPILHGYMLTKLYPLATLL
jgi:hypothetical protein